MNKKTIIALILAIILSLQPSFSRAQSNPLPTGALMRTSTAGAIYYLDKNNMRHVFPDEKVFKSWYKDFLSVIIVSEDKIKDYPLQNNIRYRPGTRLIKIQSDPKVYAIETPNFLRWIKNEDIARALYGADWAKLVDDLPDSLFFDYIMGNEISQPIHPTGTIVKYAGDTNLYLIEGGKKRLISANAITENNINSDFAINLPAGSIIYANGNSLNTKETQYSDPVIYQSTTATTSQTTTTQNQTSQTQTTTLQTSTPSQVFGALPKVNVTTLLNDNVTIYENGIEFVELMDIKIENISSTDVTLSSIKLDVVGYAKNTSIGNPAFTVSSTGANYSGSYEGDEWITFSLGLKILAGKTSTIILKGKLLDSSASLQLKIPTAAYFIISEPIDLAASFPLNSRLLTVQSKPTIAPQFNLTNTTLIKGTYNYIGLINFANCLGGKTTFNNLIASVEEYDVSLAVQILKIGDRLLSNSNNQFIYGSSFTSCEFPLYVILNNNLAATGANPRINIKITSITGLFNDGEIAVFSALPMSQNLNITP
jgi:hypothetical protein